MASSLRKPKEDGYTKEKFQYLNKTFEEKRKLYKCGRNFKTIEDVKRWGPDCQFAPQGEQLEELRKIYELPKPEPKPPKDPNIYSDYGVSWEINPLLNSKIGIFIGTFDTLEVDAIAVPSNPFYNQSKKVMLDLPRHSGNAFITDILHQAAGPLLKKECDDVLPCRVWMSKITGGYLLPAKYVIHTGAPDLEDLESGAGYCYVSSLRIAIENDFKTIAFPCFSAGGEYGIPHQKAADDVLLFLRDFLQEYHDHYDLVVLCLMNDEEMITYQDFLPHYFPV